MKDNEPSAVVPSQRASQPERIVRVLREIGRVKNRVNGKHGNLLHFVVSIPTTPGHPAGVNEPLESLLSETHTWSLYRLSPLLLVSTHRKQPSCRKCGTDVLGFKFFRK